MTSDDIKDLPPIIDQFLNSLWLEDGLSKNTLNSYRYDLKQLVAWHKNNDIVFIRKVEFKKNWPFGFQNSNQESTQGLLPVPKEFNHTFIREITIKFEGPRVGKEG